MSPIVDNARLDGLEKIGLWLSLFWAALYGFRHYRRRTQRKSTLPSLTSSIRPTSTDLFKSPTTRITLQNFHLRYHSTAWNALHQSSTARLAKRTEWRFVLQSVYDMGSLLGVLGMLGSVALLLWTTIQLSSSLYSRPSHFEDASQSQVFSKRDALIEEANINSIGGGRRSPALQLIIPGLTTPLHHLPLLLVALLTTQVIHECGHAVAAALDSVPLTLAGLGFTVILPSAFVAFPSDETETLPLRARIRLISAGAFHNLMFWLALGFASWLGTSHFVWATLGYHDISPYGRVVVGVDQDSPLYGHLPPGSVIYRVGDILLASQDGAQAQWEAIMSTESAQPTPSLGWCADEAWFLEQDTSCCSTSRHSPGSSCFTAPGTSTLERCVDPLRFLQPANGENARRCEAATECGHAQVCIHPRGDQELVSLTIHMPTWLRASDTDTERTIVWQGDKAEILDEVDVGDWQPSYEWLPMGLPFVWDTLYSYLKMLTVSLYFFNLLPLPFLDGGQLFDTLSEKWDARGRQVTENLPMRRLEEGADAPPATGTQVQRGDRGRGTLRRGIVHMVVCALLVLCTGLSLWNTYF
ncbi:hypothetical protein GY45DRAFT_1330103 [Cubamyces sp. BRFM 1775]|nr:hypothetical protein GY45DRAFT_1330103 [Cubamyces sp. BRFM 1775]